MDESKNRSNLSVTSITDTYLPLHQWAETVVTLACNMFNKQPISANVWPYRDRGASILSCVLFNENQNIRLPICIEANGKYNFPELGDALVEVDVPDMAEALHLVGIITQALNSEVKIGRGDNEVNKSVLAEPLPENQPYGQINLWKQSC